MKQNIILLIIITLLIIFVYMNRNVQIYTNSYNRIEQFVDVERESFNAGDTKHQLCTNFNEQCVGKVNGECDDSGIVGSPEKIIYFFGFLFHRPPSVEETIKSIFLSLPLPLRRSTQFIVLG